MATTIKWHATIAAMNRAIGCPRLRTKPRMASG
jgi:hypothetical protein